MQHSKKGPKASEGLARSGEPWLRATELGSRLEKGYNKKKEHGLIAEGGGGALGFAGRSETHLNGIGGIASLFQGGKQRPETAQNMAKKDEKRFLGGSGERFG